MQRLKAGTAKIEITPPIGTELCGYSPRVEKTNRSTGVHDPLWGRALALGDSKQCVIIIVLDLLGIELSTTQLIRLMIAQKIPIAAEGILIACTHNHCGPSILAEHEKGVRVDEEYKQKTIKAAAEVAIAAYQNMKPAQVSVGRVNVEGVGANRKAWLDDGSIFHFMGASARVPPKGRTVVKKGIIDPELSVLCFKDETKKIIAVLMNYASHPWIYNSNRISSEISGASVQLVEDQLRAENPDIIALFTPGTGSNITTVQNQAPIPETTTEKELWYTAERMRLGGILARAALQVIDGQSMSREVDSISAQIFPIPAPVYDRMLKAVLEEHHGLPPTSRVMHTEVQVLKVGDITLVGLPSEVYVEYGLEIKRNSRYPNTMVISQSNDYFADIITHEAVQDGVCPELEWTNVHPDIRQLIMGCLKQPVLKPH